MKRSKTVRVNISMPATDLRDIDRDAAKLGLDRSTYLRMCVVFARAMSATNMETLVTTARTVAGRDDSDG